MDGAPRVPPRRFICIPDETGWNLAASFIARTIRSMDPRDESRLRRNPDDFYRRGRINEDWQRAFRNRAPDAPCRFRFPAKFVARVGEHGEDRNVRANASRAAGSREGDE